MQANILQNDSDAFNKNLALPLYKLLLSSR